MNLLIICCRYSYEASISMKVFLLTILMKFNPNYRESTSRCLSLWLYNHLIVSHSTNHVVIAVSVEIIYS